MKTENGKEDASGRSALSAWLGLNNATVVIFNFLIKTLTVFKRDFCFVLCSFIFEFSQMFNTTKKRVINAPNNARNRNTTDCNSTISASVNEGIKGRRK